MADKNTYTFYVSTKSEKDKQFAVGETVTQSNGFRGVVTSYDTNTGVMKLSDVQGSPNLQSPIQGSTSFTVLDGTTATRSGGSGTLITTSYNSVKNINVNLANTSIIGFRIIENKPPLPPEYQSQYERAQQSIAPLARGQLTGTALQMANLNFSHVCDFRFILKTGFNFGGLPNFASLIGKTIRNAKLRAAAFIRTLVTRVVDAVRLAFAAIIKALTLDPTGEISLYVSIGQDLLDRIEYWAEKIAQFIEDILVVVEVIKQVYQLIEFIRSLPDRFKALLGQCIQNILRQAFNLVNQVTNIPNQIIGEYNRVVNGLNGQLSNAISSLEKEVSLTDQVSGYGAINNYVQSSEQSQQESSANLTYQLKDSSQASLLQNQSNENSSPLFKNDVDKIVLLNAYADNLDSLERSSNTDVLTINQYINQSIANGQSSFAQANSTYTVIAPTPYDKAKTSMP